MAEKETREEITGVVQRRPWREEDARAVVAAWEQSGKSLSVFAREHGVIAQRISWWVARLGRKSEVGFHRVRVVGESRGGTNCVIELVLVDGTRVRVPAGFAAKELKRVLGVLEARGRC